MAACTIQRIVYWGKVVVVFYVAVFWASKNFVHLSHSLRRPQTSLRGTLCCPAALSAASSWVWPPNAAHSPQPLLRANHCAYVPLCCQPLQPTDGALWLFFQNKLYEEIVLNMKAWSVVTVLSHALLPSLPFCWFFFKWNCENSSLDPHLRMELFLRRAADMSVCQKNKNKKKLAQIVWTALIRAPWSGISVNCWWMWVLL